MWFKRKEIINCSGFSERTFYRKLKEINFQKESEGNYFSSEEANKLAELLKFSDAWKQYYNKKITP